MTTHSKLCGRKKLLSRNMSSSKHQLLLLLLALQILCACIDNLKWLQRLQHWRAATAATAAEAAAAELEH